ncbi:MAG: thioredoxin family protein [Melioribacteraceae bacterium]|nr:thioredoxin family protein [Melioribacteraceae bacterium]
MATDKLKIGSALPSFELRGVDDAIRKSSDYDEKKLLLVIFGCNHCPYVQAYEERIKTIQNDYSADLQVLVINSNDEVNYPDDSFEKMKERALERGFNFPYLRDDDQSIAQKFDATHTPEIFLFDENRELKFHGKIDDNWKDENAVQTGYLRDAIDELLAGKEVSVPETFTIGCTIKWKS